MKKLLVLLSLVFLLAACSEDESETKVELEKEEPVTTETENQDEVENEETIVEKEPEEQGEVLEDESDVQAKKEEITWDDVKNQEKIVGKSDKDFSEVTKSKPNDVRNDNTGKWKILKISENIDITKYALSYADMYMKKDEVHFIVNFNYNTTTWLNRMGGLLYMAIREYEEKEEHDANKLGSGMVLKSYVIYPDGDIEELEI